MKVLFPRTPAELRAMFAAFPGGSVLAGGTDILVRLRKTGDKPPALFCLERLTALQNIAVCGEELVIGAGVTIEQLVASAIVKKTFPALWQAASVLGSPPVRHGATVGGNICTASPAGDTLPPLYVFGAEVMIGNGEDQRRMGIADFIAGPGCTALGPGEFVAGVALPLPASEEFSVYYKVGRRQALAIAVVSLAVSLQREKGGAVRRIKLAWGSVGLTVTTLPAVEEFLRGQRLSAALLRQAGAMAAAAVRPIDDVRASAAYRRQVAGNLLLRLAEGE